MYLGSTMNKVRILNFIPTPVINTMRDSTTKKTNAASKSSTMNCQTMSTVNTNQVSTVLLYDIPIVSLYIEGQERLCLAQISNTLLKQYSYNEIHNRRVALGITCVQCTPVQLEILRRAGAMPISSRRCGMITRREADRLCKSFLGDNAPPRLPEDFAFTVYHKCAWGCRGSFLPSRYNSSRAKCIKCFYCGMFFSPNKFIFHSHRVTAGDKYVQPDAANFNSWRRHMLLNGHPPEEIVHAWEDVKAMFNGGTRKRLMSHNSSTSQTTSTTQRHEQQDKLQHSINVPGSATASYTGTLNENGRGETIMTVAKASDNQYSFHDIDLSLRHNSSYLASHNLSPESTKRQCNQVENNIGTVTAAAMVGVTAVAAAVGAVRPTNIGGATPHSVSYQGRTSSVSTLQLSEGNGHEIPLSRNFMMDYMWHAHSAQKSNASGYKNRNYNNGYNITVSPFGLTDYAMHWLKTPSISSNKEFFSQLPLVSMTGSESGDRDESSTALIRRYDNNEFCQPLKYSTWKPNTNTATENGGCFSNSGQELGNRNKLVDASTSFIPQFVTSSAFKPVCQPSKPKIFNAVASVTVASTTADLATTSVNSTATISTSAQATNKTNHSKLYFSNLPTENTLPLTADSPLLHNTSITNAGTMEAGCNTAPLALAVHANFRSSASNTLQFRGPLPQNSAHSQATLAIPPHSPFRASPLGQCDLKRCDLDVKGSYAGDSHFSIGENSNNNNIDDDEMVDIETTEDDFQPNKIFKIALNMASCHHQPDDINLVALHNNPHNPEKSALAAADLILTPDYYRNHKNSSNVQPIHMLQNHVTNTNITTEPIAFDNITKQDMITNIYTTKNNNNRKLEKNCGRFCKSPVYSSTSNDSLYTPLKDESINNSTRSIEIVKTNCITHQHHTYNVGTSLLWKKLLSSEI
ncbi:uncharacterized protein LOC125779270 [Bactrocera dorsalis]|uniref:Uncharacterized protein LOC125779270 n=1 Tax=Bactrocera dorsalis TaxID=27457 RepID=A0ABM3K4B0_BACDO|nr:uncharacterized protein LOC125779270 [Bactrocera dorsalis]